MAKKESFFKGVKSEMEKTSWPTKEELFKYTVIVVSTVIFFLVFFYALDLGITALKIYYFVRGVKTCLKKLAQSVGMQCIHILDMKIKLKRI
ncbi:preprotein translocase, SecE subunit [Staphylococcus aureus]|nr:preprotein translocase, SecE subunit [Staphylococcus aureus]